MSDGVLQLACYRGVLLRNEICTGERKVDIGLLYERLTLRLTNHLLVNAAGRQLALWLFLDTYTDAHLYLRTVATPIVQVQVARVERQRGLKHSTNEMLQEGPRQAEWMLRERMERDEREEADEREDGRYDESWSARCE